LLLWVHSSHIRLIGRVVLGCCRPYFWAHNVHADLCSPSGKLPRSPYRGQEYHPRLTPQVTPMRSRNLPHLFSLPPTPTYTSHVLPCADPAPSPQRETSIFMCRKIPYITATAPPPTTPSNVTQRLRRMQGGWWHWTPSGSRAGQGWRPHSLPWRSGVRWEVADHRGISNVCMSDRGEGVWARIAS